METPLLLDVTSNVTVFTSLHREEEEEEEEEKEEEVFHSRSSEDGLEACGVGGQLAWSSQGHVRATREVAAR